MAFTVEPGSGHAAANAYVSLVFANAYHVDRGNVGWVGTDLAKQVAIVRASDYIDKRFGVRFRGYRLNPQQAMEWPRLNAYFNSGFPIAGADAVPRCLQRATAEYALRAISLGELAPDPSGEPAEGAVILKLEKIGPIEEQTRYAPRGTPRASVSDLVGPTTIPEYPAADLLIQELLTSSNNRRLIRG